MMGNLEQSTIWNTAMMISIFVMSVTSYTYDYHSRNCVHASSFNMFKYKTDL